MFKADDSNSEPELVWSVKAPKLYEKKYLKSNQSKTYVNLVSVSYLLS